MAKAQPLTKFWLDFKLRYRGSRRPYYDFIAYNSENLVASSAQICQHFEDPVTLRHWDLLAAKNVGAGTVRARRITTPLTFTPRQAVFRQLLRVQLKCKKRAKFSHDFQ
jgi:hypothetical protein